MLLNSICLKDVHVHVHGSQFAFCSTGVVTPPQGLQAPEPLRLYSQKITTDHSYPGHNLNTPQIVSLSLYVTLHSESYIILQSVFCAIKHFAFLKCHKGQEANKADSDSHTSLTTAKENSIFLMYV